MKHYTLLFIHFLFLLAFGWSNLLAQSPALINYQAVVRDANGTLITSGTINLGISIHDAITSGNQLYFETHNGITPNTFGVVNVLIGGGTVISGNFLMINWGSGMKYLQVYVNSNPIGSRTQMVSVPFALYANTSLKADSSSFAMNATNAQNADNAVSANTALIANNLNLPGTIVAYGGTTPPMGWLLCDGTSYSANQYPNLYAVISVNFGGQNGNFNVPDFRGRFLRMVDGNAGNDPDKNNRIASSTGGSIGNNVGSLQVDDFKDHQHTSTVAIITNLPNGFAAAGSGSLLAGNYTVNTSYVINNIVSGSETRPKNIYVNYIIKY